MIKITNIIVPSYEQWMAAIKGMRNPMNSWDKIDSKKNTCNNISCDNCHEICSQIELGKNDYDLMKRLTLAGTEHSKFLRMLPVMMDITAPLYWWKEYDTYKISTVANSCSTMHKIADKEFTLDDFSVENLYEDVIDRPFKDIIDCLNFFRGLYIQNNDKDDWWQMIQLLPSSYNQKRTVFLNYAVLANMYHQRKGHKLDEWHDFCNMIEKLPYNEFITKNFVQNEN